MNQLQSSPKTTRKLVVGGKFGKIKGFNFYIQDNDRLKPFQRKILLKESEDIISNLVHEETQKFGSIDKINKDLQHLDPNQNDLELMEAWNMIYNQYGYRMIPFREKWEKEHIPKEMYSENESEPIKPIKLDWINRFKLRKSEELIW